MIGIVVWAMAVQAPAAQRARRAPSAALQAAIDAERTAEGAALAEREVAACQAAPRFAEDCFDLIGESVSLQIDAGRPQQAEAHARAALAIAQAVWGEDTVATGSAYGNLGSALEAAGRLREALPAKERDLAIARRLLGEAHGDTAISYNNVGNLLARLGRYEAAEPMLRRAIAIWGALPDERRNLGIAHHGLARVLDQQGRLAEAAVELDAALAVYATILPPAHPRRAGLMTSIAINLHAQDRLPEAEAMARRALAMRETLHPAGHREIAVALKVLAMILGDAGREREAETLYRRVVAIERAALGPRHPDLAYSLANLAVGVERQGRAAESVALLREAIAILEDAAGGDYGRRSALRIRLGRALRSAGDPAGAETALREALAIAVARPMADPADPARARLALADLLVDRGQAAAALPLLEAALAALPGDASGTAAEAIEARSLYAQALYRTGRIAAAQAAIDAAAAAATARIERHGTRSREQRRGLRDFRTVFERQVAIRWTGAWAAGARGCATACAEAFRAAQWAINSSAGQAIDGAALRSGDGALAGMLRERDALLLARDASDRRHLAVTTQDPAKAADLAARIGRQDAAITAIDARIDAAAPARIALLRPRSVSLAEVQAVLAPRELLVLALPGPEAGHVWAITADRVRWVRRAALSHAALAARVGRLRAALGDGRGQPVRGQMRGQAGRVSGATFDPADAAALGDAWFAIARPMLRDHDRVLTIASGALAAIPPALLRVGGRWLIDRASVAALPSPAAMLRLRCATCSPVGHRDRGGFVGLGAVLPGAAAGDVAPLPHALDELRAIATHFPGDARLWTGAAATEARLRDDPALARARYIGFATHAVRTGDAGQPGEPALLLSPGGSDDGLLTASEAAMLRIGADLVLLSACDTAAADGSFDGEDLSGLARGFFAAGARGVLVSHWPVDDAAAARLVPALFAASLADPAGALRGAMRRLRDTPGGRWAHPRYWAAFTLVGDPGAGDLSGD